MSRSGRVKESANGTKPLMSNGTDAAGAAAGSKEKVTLIRLTGERPQTAATLVITLTRAQATTPHSPPLLTTIELEKD